MLSDKWLGKQTQFKLRKAPKAQELAAPHSRYGDRVLKKTGFTSSPGLLLTAEGKRGNRNTAKGRQALGSPRLLIPHFLIPPWSSCWQAFPSSHRRPSWQGANSTEANTMTSRTLAKQGEQWLRSLTITSISIPHSTTQRPLCKGIDMKEKGSRQGRK